MKTEKLRPETSLEKWSGRAIPMATSVVNLLGIRLPPLILALTFGVLLVIAPAGDVVAQTDVAQTDVAQTAVAQTLKTIGTLVIDGVTQQPVPVFSAGVKITAAAPDECGREGGGRVTFNAFTLTKEVDATSPTLLVSAASGRHIPRATINLFKPDGTTVLTRYVLDDVVVIGVTVTSAQDGERRVLLEEISLDYRRISQRVFTESGPFIGGWDRCHSSRS